MRQRIVGFLRDPHRRSAALASAGGAFDVAFAAWNLWLGATGPSAWFTTLGVQYLLFALMRWSTLAVARRARRAGRTVPPVFFRVQGLVLLAMVVATLGTVVIMILDDPVDARGPITSILMATYTAYRTVVVVVGLRSRHNRASTVLTALRCVNAATLLVSILSLQSSMLAQFGSGGAAAHPVQTQATGGAVCLGLVLLGVRLLRVRETVAPD